MISVVASVAFFLRVQQWWPENSELCLQRDPETKPAISRIGSSKKVNSGFLSWNPFVTEISSGTMSLLLLTSRPLQFIQVRPLQQSEFSWLKRARLRGWLYIYDLHFLENHIWFSFQVLTLLTYWIHFVSPDQFQFQRFRFCASFGWDLHQRRRLHHPGEWCDRWYHSLHGGVNRIFRWCQVWLFFLWEGWVDLFSVFLGINHLRSDQRRIFFDFGYKSVFCFTARLCLSTILPETNIFADGHVVWTWTLFQLLISNLESSFLGSSHLSLSLEKSTILQSIIFLGGVKMTNCFFGSFPSPIICLDGRIRRCAPSRSCI